MNAIGLNLIKSFEKLKLKAYQGAADRSGVYTIGYGHVITGHESPDIFKAGQTMDQVTITEEQANTLFVTDLAIAQQGIRMRLLPNVWTSLTEDQRMALTSFAFNVGVGNFGISNVRKLLNGEMPSTAYSGFKSFVRSAGQVRGGLIRRRAAEMALFKSDYPMVEYFMNKSGRVVEAKAAAYIGLETQREGD